MMLVEAIVITRLFVIVFPVLLFLTSFTHNELAVGHTHMIMWQSAKPECLLIGVMAKSAIRPQWKQLQTLQKTDADH
ncbi:hypothetical protein HY29_18245 [Hyphomonas beringensis]|uniref:Uncharacterized protein n=1 Tax=Hyphomonas beringensis TaxID=1280946 RepID=A0A062U1L3_9PROT|nr:hypothetical protein HY29_18245 [Hyphomonas beringensis]